MIFLYGVYNRMSNEPPSQARVPAETEPEALALIHKTFENVLNHGKDGEPTLDFQLLDVQDVTDEDDLNQILILTPNGMLWTREME